MFGWFKPKMAPEGPIEIEMDIIIERSADDVYAMIDFGDPRHHKAAVGTITRTGDRTFDMVVDMLPDLTFAITEREAVPGKTYSYECVIPQALNARMLRGTESYVLKSLGPGECKVTMQTLACFKPMKMKHFDREVALVAAGCQNSLAKLKIYAERGVEAIREIEARQVA